MSIHQKIAFIGSGEMAEAMIAGLLRQGLVSPTSLLASGPRPERGEELQIRYGILPFTDNAAATRQADIIVLAIKPQRLERVLDDLQHAVQPEALVLSIVAGAPLATLSTRLNNRNVVRAMPNTPAKIGQGITVWTAYPEVSEEQCQTARRILAALGDEVYMEEEDFLDKATALSGTGPAYVFLFMEALVDAGVHLGFPRRIAEQLVTHTVAGSVAFYQQLNREEPHHLARMRNQVTSPGGTSAEALYYLEKAGFRTALSRAIWAAYERSVALGHDPKTERPAEG
jgi:pyrroline-5-carboxylate reductase